MSTPTELFVADITLVATEAILEGYAVKHDTDPYTAQLASTAGERCLGVAEYDVADTEALRVILIGLCKCVASEAIAIGERISISTGGKFQVAASGEYVVGTAYQAASGDGKIFAAWIQPSLIPLA